MKNIVYFLVLIALFAFVAADLKPLDTKDAVTFTIKNFGLNVNGELSGLKGKIKWDATNPANSSFDVSVDVNTINTGIDSRDSHLKKEDYFNVEKYPTIRLTGTAVTPTDFTGTLTIKGIAKKISFPFKVTPMGNGFLFQGNFSISRKDFGVGGSSAVLSENINVVLKVSANP